MVIQPVIADKLFILLKYTNGYAFKNGSGYSYGSVWHTQNSICTGLYGIFKILFVRFHTAYSKFYLYGIGNTHARLTIDIIGKIYL